MVKLGIKKPVTTLMLVFAIILFAIVGFTRIPVELYPNTESGEVSVITRLRGGIAAMEVEKYVTRPLEEVFSEINGLKELSSASRESESNIILKFHHEVNTDLATIDIREKLASVRHLLPKETDKPTIAKFQQSDTPMMIISMSSEKQTPEQLRGLAEDKIKDRLLRVSGVANVEIGGGRERKFLIEIDNAKLIAYDLPILQVIERINLANISVSAGEIVEGYQKHIIRVTGEYKDINEISDTGIAITPAGSVIRIRDIAEVKDSFFEATSFARLNVKSVVSLYLQKESSANTITVASEVKKALKEVEKIAPPDVVVTVVKNDADFILKAIDSLEKSLRDGALLVSFILFLFLNDLRIILVIIATIPISLAIAVFLIYATGLSFNVMTLSGLAMGVGMLMDNAVIIISNLAYHDKHGSFPDKESMVIEGTNELMLPILASTVATVIVFLPLVFVDPEIKQLYMPFAMTITFSMIASLVSTLIFLPPLCLRWLKDFGMSATKLYLFLEAKYLKLLAKSFRHQRVIWGITVFLLFLSVWILAHKDSEFIEPGDANTFRVGIQFPPATRIERSDEIVKKMEKVLLEYSQVKRVSSKVEKLHTFLEVMVAKDPEGFKNKFRKRFSEFSPAFIYYQESQQASSKEVFLDLFGFDYDVLKQIAFAASGRLSQVKEISDVKIRMREDEPEVHIMVDQNKLTLFNLTTLYFGNTLHAHFRGLIATQYRTEGKEIETIARLIPGTVRSIKELPFHTVISTKGDIVSIGQVADIKQKKATQEIWHKNKKRFIQISANRSKAGLTLAVDKMRKVLSTMKFPKDYSFDFSGDYEKTVRNKKQFSMATVLTIILIYLVLASLFESYLQPVLIMSALPLSIIGVALLLWVAKKSISLGVWIGIMILFGSVVNGSIILVEKINTRRQGKKGLLKPLIGSCKERFQSISIVTLSKILGLVPLVLSRDEAAEMWRALGLTIIGGEITGTVLSLFLIPMAYLQLDRATHYISSAMSRASERMSKLSADMAQRVVRLIMKLMGKNQTATIE
jgi:HAE1 family hydrophobic/amphiphilic exporter-1